MDERAHDRGQGPLDADAASPPAEPTHEPAREEPPTERPAEAASTPPVLILPRAAGGGAGAVVVPAVVVSELPFTLATEPPEPAPTEPALAPIEPDSAAAATSIIEMPEAPPLPPPTQQCELEYKPPVEPDSAEPSPARLEWSEETHAPEQAEPPPPLAVEPPPLEPVLLPGPISLPPPASIPGEPTPAFAVIEPPALPRIEPTFAPAAPALPAPPHAPPDIWRTEVPPSRRAPEAQPAVEPWRLSRPPLRGVLAYAAMALAGLAGVVLLLVVLYRWVDPPVSTLMLGQRLTGTPITQRWVPLERISPNLITAVIVSEDGAFCRHRGVDWGELKEAIENAADGIARGGSTISMQVVKNLFLWPSRNYVRKAIEIPLTYVIEAAWSKQRILEIYLNIAEWGPGVFGAEAAARHHFRKPAYLLNPREAALLAVSLPNPFDRQAGRPGPGTARLADNLLLRMRSGQGNTACVRPVRPIR